jgi:hypothetical protein
MEFSVHPHAAVPGQVEFKSVGLPRDPDEGDPDEEFDREFQDFIESITLTDEEFAVFLAMPEASVLEVKRLFAGRPPRGDPACQA